MRLLVVGSGGREHALAWALAKDPDNRIYAAPGNPGIAEIGTCVPINATNTKELASFATREQIDLTVVGPEAALGAGIVDEFHNRKLKIFGPDKRAAQIETSKSFAKQLCTRHSIPTPRWESFTDSSDAKNALEEKLHALVCDKTLSLKQAQDLIRKDWVKAYDKYVTNAD